MENSGETEDGSEDRLKFSRAAGTPEKVRAPNSLAEANFSGLRVLDVERVCYGST